MKVRANTEYIFYPNLLDRCSPSHHGLTPGDIVKVVNLYGCPPCNTMGHAHVELNGRFIGLVHTNSLHPLSDVKIVIDAIKADIGRIERKELESRTTYTTVNGQLIGKVS